MRLLVLAHIPPPVHGQSVMVQALVEGLRNSPGLTIHHVNFQLSRDSADIGRWRVGKVLHTAAAALRAVVARFRHGCDTLYYIPAPPGKRGALHRDWLVMALCRPFFRRLVLHWHAVGLGEWLGAGRRGFERAATRFLLGRPDLSIVLAPGLEHDAVFLGSRRIAVVPNGVRDPGPPPVRDLSARPFQVLFLGLCSEEKGVFAAADAVIAANGRGSPPRFKLVAAGSFPDGQSAARLRALQNAHPDAITHAGFADEEEKRRLFAASHCLMLPTRYAAEGLPLVVLEALAHDLPVIATRWRALPSIVTAECGKLVEPRNSEQLRAALLSLASTPPPPGACRARFLAKYRMDLHLASLVRILLELDRSRHQRIARQDS